MPFARNAEVVVKQVDEKDWEVRRPLRYRGRREVLEVPVEQGTDFASVPLPFTWFLPRYGAYTKAAILHDFLWRERAAKGTMKWVEADGIFRRAMRELGVPFLRRWIMWSAVRWAALFKPGGRTGWLREAPRVLLMTVVVLPFVVLPAVTILVSLAAFFARDMVEAELRVPWDRQQLRGEIFAACEVVEERAEADGAVFRVRARPDTIERLRSP